MDGLALLMRYLACIVSEAPCVSVLFFYQLPASVSDSWLIGIIDQAKDFNVELEVHPEKQFEYQLLRLPT